LNGDIALLVEGIPIVSRRGWIDPILNIVGSSARDNCLISMDRDDALRSGNLGISSSRRHERLAVTVYLNPINPFAHGTHCYVGSINF
jgi:hypothetical protein